MMIQEIPDNIPDQPGIYFFIKKEKERDHILYIGKATSLRSRIRSYFPQTEEGRKRLVEGRGVKIISLIEEANTLHWETTDSVLEALILESRLIKQNQPFYNSREKDDRSYAYVVITKEELPRIFVVRERELLLQKSVSLPYKVAHSFGPFPYGQALRDALKVIRKIFPFRDKKSLQEPHERFYTMLGLTPDLSQERAKENYIQNIRHIVQLFQGKKKSIIKEIDHRMKQLSKELRFEEANLLKKQRFALQHIQDIALIKDDIAEQEKTFRIEAYDIAHLAGKNTVGVMTVVIDGFPEPREYRKFKIRHDSAGSDTDALRELLSRRIAHNEWKRPDILVVDGGLAQKRIGEEIMRLWKNKIPVISVVKDNRHKPKELRGKVDIVIAHQKAILLANAEAHRFALKFHRELRKKMFVG